MAFAAEHTLTGRRLHSVSGSWWYTRHLWETHKFDQATVRVGAVGKLWATKQGVESAVRGMRDVKVVPA